MRTPEEFTLVIKQASEIFTTVVGKPNDNNLLAIADSLIFILLQVVKFNGTANIHKLFGVVATDKDYLATTGQAETFSVPAILSVYDKTIRSIATIATCIRLEAAQAAKINNRDLYEVADAGCQSFILAAVDEVRYRKLRDSRTIYSQVTAKQLLAHLRTVCTGLHEIKEITILLSMMSMYEDMESIPKYINVLEESRKRSARAAMTITDK